MRPTLTEKLRAVCRVAEACGIARAHRLAAYEKTCRGHAEHGDDIDDIDVTGELRAELADVAGYGALALLTDRWTWRTWVAVVLAGMAWRVLGRE